MQAPTSHVPPPSSHPPQSNHPSSHPQSKHPKPPQFPPPRRPAAAAPSQPPILLTDVDYDEVAEEEEEQVLQVSRDSTSNS